MVRSFCPECGTLVLSSADENTDFVAIRVGTLDDPNSAAPDTVIWTGSAPIWAVHDRSLVHVEGQPGPVGAHELDR